MSPVIVLYDVSDDERRDALRALFRLSGRRVQQSAWMLAPGETTPERIVRGASTLLQPGDRLRAIRPCGPAWLGCIGGRRPQTCSDGSALIRRRDPLGRGAETPCRGWLASPAWEHSPVRDQRQGTPAPVHRD